MIKHLSFASLFLSAVLATAGCQRSADFGRVQEEALAVVKVHATQLDILQRRADRLQQRGRSVPSNAPGVGDAGRTLSDARAQLDQLRGLTSSAPTLIANAAKTNQLEELGKVFDEVSEKLDKGTARIRADLGAVENWVAYAETRAVPAAAAPTR